VIPGPSSHTLGELFDNHNTLRKEGSLTHIKPIYQAYPENLMHYKLKRVFGLKQPKRPVITIIGISKNSVFPSSRRQSMEDITVCFPGLQEHIQPTRTKRPFLTQASTIASQRAEFSTVSPSPTFTEAMEALEEKLHHITEANQLSRDSDQPNDGGHFWVNEKERKYIKDYAESIVPQCYLRSFIDPADQALFGLVGMGFPIREARKALMRSDNGCRPHFELALEILLWEQDN